MTNSKLAQQVDAALAAANPQPPRELTNEDRADHGRQLTAAYIAISPGLDTGDDATNAADAICDILHAIAADHGPDAAESALSMCSIHLAAELDEAAEAAAEAAETDATAPSATLQDWALDELTQAQRTGNL
jgi:hypothetical protein